MQQYDHIKNAQNALWAVQLKSLVTEKGSGLCVSPTQSPDSRRKTIVYYGGEVVNNHIVAFPTGFYYTSFTTTETVDRATCCFTVSAAYFLSWAHEMMKS